MESCKKVQGPELQARAFPEYPASGDIGGSHGVTRAQQQQQQQQPILPLSHAAATHGTRPRAPGALGGRRLLGLLLTSSSFFPCQSPCSSRQTSCKSCPSYPSSSNPLAFQSRRTKVIMATTATASRSRRPSTSAPVAELSGPIGPAGITRPKHKRTITGFGASDIKSVEAEIPDAQKTA